MVEAWCLGWKWRRRVNTCKPISVSDALHPHKQSDLCSDHACVATQVQRRDHDLDQPQREKALVRRDGSERANLWSLLQGARAAQNNQVPRNDRHDVLRANRAWTPCKKIHSKWFKSLTFTWYVPSRKRLSAKSFVNCANRPDLWINTCLILGQVKVQSRKWRLQSLKLLLRVFVEALCIYCEWMLCKLNASFQIYSPLNKLFGQNFG